VQVQASFVMGGNGLSVGAIEGRYYQGDNYLILAARAAGARLARLERSVLRGAVPAEAAQAKDVDIAGYTQTGDTLMFATLTLPEPGCWTIDLSAGTNTLEYTLYAYPWECRPPEDRAFAPPPGITPAPCTRP
jgi:hypothetical protein